jgi:CTP synthase
VATQAHPELKSRPTRPHPLFAAFVRAVVGYAAADQLPVELGPPVTTPDGSGDRAALEQPFVVPDEEPAGRAGRNGAARQAKAKSSS